MILEKTWTHHRSITDYTLSKQEFNRRVSIKQTFNIIDSNKNEKRLKRIRIIVKKKVVA